MSCPFGNIELSRKQVGTLTVTYRYQGDTPARPTDFFFRIDRTDPRFQLKFSELPDQDYFLRIGPLGVENQPQTRVFKIWDVARDVPQGSAFLGCDDISQPYFEQTICKYRIERAIEAGAAELFAFPPGPVRDVPAGRGDICPGNIFGLFLDGFEFFFDIARKLALKGVLTDADIVPRSTRLEQIADPALLRNLRQNLQAGVVGLDTPQVPKRISRDGLDAINRFVGSSPDTDALLANGTVFSDGSADIAELSTMLSGADEVNPELIEVLDRLSRREIGFSDVLTSDELLVNEAVKIANLVATDTGVGGSAGS